MINAPNQPAIPALPQQATWDQQMRFFEAQQRERVVESNRAVMQAILSVQTTPASFAAPTRAELVWQYLLRQPHVIGMTELPAVDAAVRVVDAYLTRFPRP
jgi:hypothetical protein